MDISSEIQEFDFFLIRVIDDETIHYKITKDLQFDATHAREIFDACNNAMKGKYFLINEMYTVIQPSKEVFEFYASKERASRILADAFVLGSSTLRITSNFYLKFKSLPIQTRVFDRFDEALNWINITKITTRRK